jgi:hypothetical protein
MKRAVQKKRAAAPVDKAAPVRSLRDSRFHQLLDLAREGDLGAIAELWNRYEYQFPEDLP